MAGQQGAVPPVVALAPWLAPPPAAAPPPPAAPLWPQGFEHGPPPPWPPRRLADEVAAFPWHPPLLHVPSQAELLEFMRPPARCLAAHPVVLGGTECFRVRVPDGVQFLLERDLGAPVVELLVELTGEYRRRDPQGTVLPARFLWHIVADGRLVEAPCRPRCQRDSSGSWSIEAFVVTNVGGRVGVSRSLELLAHRLLGWTFCCPVPLQERSLEELLLHAGVRKRRRSEHAVHHINGDHWDNRICNLWPWLVAGDGGHQAWERKTRLEQNARYAWSW